MAVFDTSPTSTQRELPADRREIGAAPPGAPVGGGAPNDKPGAAPNDNPGAPGDIPFPSVVRSACPEDMAYVETDFCPNLERHCIDMEYDKSNHLPICHVFAREERCREPERHIVLCIDQYEYPNREGAHSIWMLNWYQAQATCESRQKRLCWASEWTAACEGPERTPFPYGWRRNHEKCNVDNFLIEPRKLGPKAQFFFYSKDRDVASKELSRLDQSVLSGAIETCRSGFGVYDMTGNLDEWVVSDEPPRAKSRWAGLKGGAWGHVRSQCRPTTYSHEPEFSYYFVGFRCCRDVDGAPRWTPSPQAIEAPAVEPHDFAEEPVVVVGPVGPSKAKFSRNGRIE